MGRGDRIMGLRRWGGGKGETQGLSREVNVRNKTPPKTPKNPPKNPQKPPKTPKNPEKPPYKSTHQRIPCVVPFFFTVFTPEGLNMGEYWGF